MIFSRIRPLIFSSSSSSSPPATNMGTGGEDEDEDEEGAVQYDYIIVGGGVCAGYICKQQLIWVLVERMRMRTRRELCSMTTSLWVVVFAPVIYASNWLSQGFSQVVSCCFPPRHVRLMSAQCFRKAISTTLAQPSDRGSPSFTLRTRHSAKSRMSLGTKGMASLSCLVMTVVYLSWIFRKSRSPQRRAPCISTSTISSSRQACDH